jgi:hypothetical protein
MSLPTDITASLARLTPEALQAMEPAERQALSDQLRRVYRIIEGDRIIEAARQATAPRADEAAFFKELRDGRGRE